MTEPTKPVRVRDWPRIWWHDEKFWREVATRALAGLIVVFVGYLFAVATGYLERPPVRAVLAFVVSAAIFLGGPYMLLLVGHLQDIDRLERIKQKKKVRARWIDHSIFVLAGIAIAALAYFAIAILSVWGNLGTLFVH